MMAKRMVLGINASKFERMIGRASAARFTPSNSAPCTAPCESVMGAAATVSPLAVLCDHSAVGEPPRSAAAMTARDVGSRSMPARSLADCPLAGSAATTSPSDPTTKSDAFWPG